MTLNKIITLISFIFIILLCMNLISATDVNETNLETNVIEIDYDTTMNQLDDTNFQNLNNDKNPEELLQESEYNNIYVSPNGSGDGASNENPSSFLDALDTLEDNTIVHMSDGNYTIDDTIFISSNNIKIIAENSDNVKIISNLKNKNVFEVDSNVNLNFENILLCEFYLNSKNTLKIRMAANFLLATIQIRQQ